MKHDSNGVDVSIIMPVYNSAKYIEETLDAILEEKVVNIELIIINDASTDDSLSIIRNYEKKDSRIKVINFEVNSRQGTARNRGLDIAKGKYILFTDSDDILHKNAIKKVFDMQEKMNSDVCAFAYQRMMDIEGKRNYYLDDGNQRNILNKIAERSILDNQSKASLFINTAGVCNNLFKKSIIDEFKIRFPERMIYEDNYFVKLYMLYVNKYAYVNEILYDYREHNNSTTKKVNDIAQFDRLKIEELKLEAFKERNLYDEFKEAINFDFLRLYYLNSIGLFMRRDNVPYDTLKLMRNRIKPILKEVKQSEYYSSLRKAELIKLKLSLVSFKLLHMVYKFHNI